MTHSLLLVNIISKYSLEDIEDMFTRYYMHSEALDSYIFNYLTLCYTFSKDTAIRITL